MRENPQFMRYYVPSIEEFIENLQIGFEFEIINYASNDFDRDKSTCTWDERKVDKEDLFCDPLEKESSLEVWLSYLREGHVRVRKLSGYDIKDLGWKLEQEEKVKHHRYLYSKKVRYTRGTHECRLLHVPATEWVLIFFPLGELSVPENNENEDTVIFAGKVRNKSELKKLFQMLQIQ